MTMKVVAIGALVGLLTIITQTRAHAAGEIEYRLDQAFYGAPGEALTLWESAGNGLIVHGLRVVNDGQTPYTIRFHFSDGTQISTPISGILTPTTYIHSDSELDEEQTSLAARGTNYSLHELALPALHLGLDGQRSFKKILTRVDVRIEGLLDGGVLARIWGVETGGPSQLYVAEETFDLAVHQSEPLWVLATDGALVPMGAVLEKAVQSGSARRGESIVPVGVQGRLRFVGVGDSSPTDDHARRVHVHVGRGFDDYRTAGITKHEYLDELVTVGPGQHHMPLSAIRAHGVGLGPPGLKATFKARIWGFIVTGAPTFMVAHKAVFGCGDGDPNGSPANTQAFYGGAWPVYGGAVADTLAGEVLSATLGFNVRTSEGIRSASLTLPTDLQAYIHSDYYWTYLSTALVALHLPLWFYVDAAATNGTDPLVVRSSVTAVDGFVSGTGCVSGTLRLWGWQL